MRNQVFFEILHGFKLFSSKLSIYNTYPNKYCGKTWLKKWLYKTPYSLFKVYIKNGPRYWKLDSIYNINKHQSKQLHINDMKFIKCAYIDMNEIKKKTINNKLKPWNYITIYRDASWIYYKNLPIYILIDDVGVCWVLQSTATLECKYIENSQEYTNKNKLPSNWKFIIKTFSENIKIPSIDGKARILRDNYNNTFVKAEKTSNIYDYL